MNSHSRIPAALILALCALPPAWGQEASWPDLSSPARAVGGGERDAALVVGIEAYDKVPGIPGARANAKEWYQYLTETRGIPPQSVKLLTDEDAAREQILGEARKVAARAGEGGTLWFVFVGHGAPSSDGKDGLLVGADARQTAESLEARSVRRGELLKVLGQSKAVSIAVLLDACFSGRGQDGGTIAPGLQPLQTVVLGGAADPRMVVLTAAKGNQYAGALPGANRPAFSYLVLGGLRGWAARGQRAAVTAGDLWRYAGNALEATLRGRKQEPDLMGKEGAVLGASAGEKAPDLRRLALATAGSAGGGFQITSLPAVPSAQAPRALGSDAVRGLDFRNLDIEALKKKSEAVKFDKSGAAAEDKAQAWRRLGQDVPQFADKANERAAQWERFAAQRAAVEEAKRKRASARDSDWSKLSELLALDEAVVPQASKASWSSEFLRAYFKSPGVEPAMARGLAAHVPPGAMRESLKALARSTSAREAASAPPAARVAGGGRVAAGKAGIQWVSIPGGSFMMGSEGGADDEKPRHRVTIKSFQLAKTEVTNRQYRACVEAGACSAPDSYEGEDDHPVVKVDWEQARKFSEWAGGRLPTEAEWEYAARGAGRDQKFPWGNEEATCARAVMKDGGYGCGKGSSWPVCSKTAGNTAQGLCDMLGNVWEWTQDCFQYGGYTGAPTDGSAWESPAVSEYRVYRGGAWGDVAEDVRSAMRMHNPPGGRFIILGFRPAR